MGGGRAGARARRARMGYEGSRRLQPALRAAIEDCPFQAPEHWLVGTLGRMEAVKDPMNLAKAFVHVLSLHPDARDRIRLVMIGDGTQKNSVVRLLADAGVRDLAWLPGERSDIPALMRGLDCFALPSGPEGVSTVILDAMATALAIIAT